MTPKVDTVVDPLGLFAYARQQEAVYGRGPGPGLRFPRMQLHEVRARGNALFAAAAAETGSPGDPQWRFLDTLEAGGALLIVGAELDGNLVGYACACVGGEFWSPEIVCTTLSMFVQPPHRWRAGLQLLRAVWREGQAMGATTLRVQAIPGSRLERLCLLLGFTPRAIALESSNMQYTASHGRGHSRHRDRSSRIRGLRRRTPGGDCQAGPAPAGRSAEQGRGGGGE